MKLKEITLRLPVEVHEALTELSEEMNFELKQLVMIALCDFVLDTRQRQSESNERTECKTPRQISSIAHAIQQAYEQ